MDCDFNNDDMQCASCGYTARSRDTKRNCGKQPTPAPVVQPSHLEVVDEALKSVGHGRGLGDITADALSAIGITKQLVSAMVGAPCNCPERQEKLNALGRWVMGRIGL